MILSEGNIVSVSNNSINGNGAINQDEIVFENNTSLKEAKKGLEKNYISKALRNSGGNKSVAARELELSYPSLLNKIKEYKLG